MQIQKKEKNGRKYYYLVTSTRKDGKVRKIERYVGLNKPTEEEIEKFEQEFNKKKLFLSEIASKLEKIRKNNIERLKNSSKDQLLKEEEEKIISFTYDSNRIEGSSLSKKDTKFLLKDNISPANKPIRDIKEAENHKEAYLWMKDNLSKEISRELILKLHTILKKEVTEDAGKFRDAQIFVSDLIPIKADLIESEIKNLTGWLKKNKDMHTFEKAVIFHCMFEKIHPFFDGNGRVGRLLLNLILMKNKFPLVNLQNKNKRRYYNALKRADDENYLYMLKYVFSEMG